MGLETHSSSFLVAIFACFTVIRASETCSNKASGEFDYSNVITATRQEGLAFQDLPGFTRSFYERDHALIAPESRVWASFPGWSNSTTAHLISPASGAHFSMYLADMGANGASAPPPGPRVERFVFVLQGEAAAEAAGSGGIPLPVDHYAYFPPGTQHRITSASGARMVVFERPYAIEGGAPELQAGSVASRPPLPTPGEVFVLRKLMPATGDYDFNVHVMDFAPGEHLNVKEVHYNQHGLLLLQGKGIYRLSDKWFPVQAGDAIYMGPFVPQWYAALGHESTRYLLYKDTTVDPLHTL